MGLTMVTSHPEPAVFAFAIALGYGSLALLGALVLRRRERSKPVAGGPIPTKKKQNR
jgi:hypothetical protein